MYRSLMQPSVAIYDHGGLVQAIYRTEKDSSANRKLPEKVAERRGRLNVKRLRHQDDRPALAHQEKSGSLRKYAADIRSSQRSQAPSRGPPGSVTFLQLEGGGKEGKRGKMVTR